MNDTPPYPFNKFIEDCNSLTHIKGDVDIWCTQGFLDKLKGHPAFKNTQEGKS